MFNPYVWKLYLEAGGQEIADMFRRNLGENLTVEYVDQITLLQKSYCVMECIIEESATQIKDLIDFYTSPEALQDENDIIDPEEQIEAIYNNLLDCCGSPADAFDNFALSLCYISTDLSICFPESFVPYYFRMNFNVLQKIANMFDIELPEIPVKKDYRGRFFYYQEISKTFLSFMRLNGLSVYELYAFLYDFAPKCVGGIDSYLVKELPAPESAYFIGADKDDRFLSNNNGVTIWQCNPDTRVGDMIVMYLRTPVSAVKSVWRACSLGFIDPFFFYYRCVYISNPIEIKPFTLNAMREDHIFKELPIVRKNMQGINGVELYPSVYNHLIKLSKADLPVLEYVESYYDGEYINEKAVETKLIKPLIEKLGYSESDYKQQMYVEIGNHNKALIPDFVLLPDERRGFASGYAIIEAKRSIKSENELKEVMVQARSYAKILTAKYCAVASMEKIWITQRKDNYDELIFESSWSNLNNTDVFYRLNKILGK